jgi:hypothetical protein
MLSKKRDIFYALIISVLFILMPNAYATYGKLVYSGTVDDGNTIDIENIPFNFRVDSVSSKVYVEIDNSGLIVPIGDCKSLNNFGVCVNNISFSYRNLTDYRDVYEATLEVYQIKSEITITNTIKKNSILMGEETNAELSFENTADTLAEDVTASIQIPSSISVTNLEGCKKTSNLITFHEDVHPTQIKKCTYTLEGLTGDDFELVADVSYFNGIGWINTTSDTLNVKVYNHSLKIEHVLNKSKFSIGENLDLKVKIENINDEYELRVTNLNIKIPQKISILKTPEDTLNNNQIIRWIGSLAPNENKEFIILLKSPIIGNHSILTEANYKIETFSRTAQKKSDIEVYCDCPYLSHKFSGEIVPGQHLGIKAFIDNPNTIDIFDDIKIKYSSNIPDLPDFSSNTYSDINPLEGIKIFDFSTIAPSLEEIYYFNITFTFKSPNNQIFIVKDNIIIEVPSEEVPIEEEQEETEIVILETGITEEIINDTKEEIVEEVPVIELKDEEENSFIVYAIVAIIAAILFILVVLTIFKKKKSEPEIYPLKKVPLVSNHSQNVKIEADYEDLEGQVRELGNVFEQNKSKKRGFFNIFYRKK